MNRKTFFLLVVAFVLMQLLFAAFGAIAVTVILTSGPTPAPSTPTPAPAEKIDFEVGKNGCRFTIEKNATADMAGRLTGDCVEIIRALNPTPVPTETPTPTTTPSPTPKPVAMRTPEPTVTPTTEPGLWWGWLYPSEGRIARLLQLDDNERDGREGEVEYYFALVQPAEDPPEREFLGVLYAQDSRDGNPVTVAVEKGKTAATVIRQISPNKYQIFPWKLWYVPTAILDLKATATGLYIQYEVEGMPGPLEREINFKDMFALGQRSSRDNWRKSAVTTSLKLVNQLVGWFKRRNSVVKNAIGEVK